MPELHPLGLAYAREYPGEVATFLASQGDEAVAAAVEALPEREAAAVVARLPNGHAARVLAGQDDAGVAAWLDVASADHALALLLHLDETRRARVLDLLPRPRMRHALERLLNYPQTSVGALVDPTAVRLDAAMPLAEAVAVLRTDAPGPEQSIWLVDEQGRYAGRLDLARVLATASDKLRLAELAIAVRPLRAETTLATALDFAAWQKYLELPVIDRHDHLLGALSHARLVSAAAEGGHAENGFVAGMGELTRQYFRVIAICLGDLLGLQGRSP